MCCFTGGLLGLTQPVAGCGAGWVACWALSARIAIRAVVEAIVTIRM
jgi:hypothetical protein